MNLRSAAAAAVALAMFAGCKPAVRGRCDSSADCRSGASCGLDGICLASSGTCTPTCGAGEICSGSTCAMLKPVVTVQAPQGAISPAQPQIAVHVDAAAGLALHSLDVEVDNSDHAVATGSLTSPQAGSNVVTLSHFEAGAVGSVSVRATLRYQVAGQPEESALSVAVPAVIDAAAPTVAVFVPPGQSGVVNGWFPRDGGTIEVRATVDDGAGSGPQSATLSFATCPATAACTIAGAVASRTGGVAVFSFLVPRLAQAAGSEAPLAITVKALDAAGNQGQGAGVLQIDDAPPQIGAFKVISPAGVLGEDGKTWFPGGNGAPVVEIAVPVSDAGAGFNTLGLHLDSTDLNGYSGSLDLPVSSTGPDGVHFQLPASGVHGKEQHVRFTLTATDQLKNQQSVGPNDPRTMIWVDAAPPTVSAPHVVYSSALPSTSCGLPDGSSFSCGRQLSTASPHVLADDVVTVTYDAYDCGVGTGSPQSATVKTAASSPPGITTAETGADGSPCSGVNGSPNKTHHYSFTLNLAALSLVLDAPVDINGTTLVRLTANGQDLLQQGATSPPAPAGATSGDGLALVSLWRWKNRVAGTVTQPTGSPALLPGNAGGRQIAVGTSLTGGPGIANLFVLGPDGSRAWSATTSGQSLAGDLAVGTRGNIYVTGPSTASACGSGCSAFLDVIVPPASIGNTGTSSSCTVSNVSFGSPPALAVDAGSERAVVTSNGHAAGATSNVFLFHESGGSCIADTPVPVGAGSDYAGLSASWPTIFLASAVGFTAIDFGSGGILNVATQRSYSGATLQNPTAPSVAPPVASPTDTAPRAFFGSGSDPRLRSALQTSGTPCGAGMCWADDPAFPSAHPANPVPATPVFDAAWVFAADDHGVVYGYPRSTGPAAWSVNLRSSTALPALWPPPPSTPATTSPPVLLQGETALIVRSDGVVALVTAAGAVPLLQVAATATPVAPVVDVHGGGGVAYVADGNGWVTALQTAAAPLPAGQNVWPRPGRDSCNSRNAASQCQ